MQRSTYFYTLFVFCTFVLSFLFLQPEGIPDYTYFKLCLSGTADDLEQNISTHNLDVNKKFKVYMDGGQYPELELEILINGYNRPMEFTPLFLSAGNKDPLVTKLLINKGAVATPKALARALDKGMRDNAILLAENMIKNNLVMSSSDHIRPAVTFFVNKPTLEEKDKLVLQYLIDRGVFSDDRSSFLLDAAARVGAADFYTILEKNGIPFHDMASELLAKAAAEGRIETTRLFLARGGDPNVMTRQFRLTDDLIPQYIDRPLIVRAAMWNGGVEVLAALLEAGANPNAADTDGETALMHLDKKIHHEQLTLQRLQSGEDKTTYWEQNKEPVPHGTPRWKAEVQNHMNSIQKWILVLEQQQTVLVNGGATH